MTLTKIFFLNERFLQKMVKIRGPDPLWQKFLTPQKNIFPKIFRNCEIFEILQFLISKFLHVSDAREYFFETIFSSRTIMHISSLKGFCEIIFFEKLEGGGNTISPPLRPEIGVVNRKCPGLVDIHEY